jgi:deoxycytidylate deaminase
MTTSLVNKLKTLRNQSNHIQHKVSAIILYKGRPLSFGYNNQTKTHPKIKKYSEVKTMHAEMAALFRMKDTSILKNCSIVVYREDRMGNAALAKPCDVCQAILKDYGIKEITYSTPDGWEQL